MTTPYTDCETLLSFLGFAPSDLTLLRVLSNPHGRGDADVACALDLNELRQLLKEAEREPYVAPDGTPRVYRGTYARLCHTVPPRSWLDSGRPRITEATATRYPAFVVDIDAVKSGESATDAEAAQTVVIAGEIITWLTGVLGADLSFALQVASGNGTQLLVRTEFGIEEAWLPRVLLLRMRARWPQVDDAGWKLTVGPAVPGTRKCKGAATAERPHRIVRVTRAFEGDRRLSAEDVQRLVDALPEVANEAAPNATWTRAYDEFSAVAELPIEDVCEQLFGESVVCPVCKSTDAAVAVVRTNVVTCQHRNRCEAARAGKTGFTAVVAFGMKLGFGWRDFTPAQRAEIVETARSEGFELVWDEDQSWEPERVAALEVRVRALPMFRPEPSRHVSIRATNAWTLTSKSPGHVAELVEASIVRSYCPDWADHQTLVLCGRLYAYHQELGIWVAISPTADIDRVERILNDQGHKGIWASDGSKSKKWAPPTRAVMDALERIAPMPAFFRGGKVGLACRDGFIELDGGKWRAVPHHPSNRARGRVAKTCVAVLRDIENGDANAAVLALRALIVRTLRRDDEYVDSVLAVFLEQVGGVICRVRPELRNAIFLHGGEDTGKSSLLRIAKAMAERLGLTVTGSTLGDLNGTFPDESLLGSDLNIAMDEGAFDGGRAAKTARFKQIVEGSQWSFARKNRPNIQVACDLLWLSASNSEPAFAESSGAISKRIYIIEYPSTPAKVLDREMVPRFLREHLDGLVAASLIGAARLAQHGRTNLPDDSEVMQHTRELSRAVGLVEAWVQSDVVKMSAANETDAPYDEAHAACIRWGERHGYRDDASALRPDRFTRELNRQCRRKVRWSHGSKMAPVALMDTASTAEMPGDGPVDL